MGRIKTKQIKRITMDLMEEHPDIFGRDYYENRKLVEKHIQTSSKKLRNTITGYVTRLSRAN